MAKKLHLAVAELTDVGRRRERNQDNVTHFIPPDEQALEEKGALFVVCDGMGGHAAGEVASELGVNTIRDVYYSTHDADIISGLANAIKNANEAIFSYAREHTEATGMGTTCVALVVHGGRGYFVNIGDSRAYLVRDRQMRQITLDHSWVAEQVRAGLLTEEQARTHAHRNVITRSMGTQPTINADLFVETLRDGDRILLCSDGLHGYVDEAEIEREMLTHRDPEEGAQTLIDMANANGGPDNITAIIVQMLEVPEVTDELRLPTIADNPEQIITQPVPAIAGKTTSKQRRKPTEPPEPVMPAAQKRKKRTASNRVATAALRLMAVAALILLGLGVWDFTYGPYAVSRAATMQLQQDTAQVSTAAQKASSQDPATALVALARTRQRVETDLQNQHVDPQGVANAQSVLDTQLVPAVQSTIQRYNAAAQITPVSISTAVTYPVSCTATGASTPNPLTAVKLDALAVVTPPPLKKNQTVSFQTLYAVSGGTLYEINVPVDSTGAPGLGAPICMQVPLPNNASAIALTSDGSTLYALAQQANGPISVDALTSTSLAADGTPIIQTKERFAVATPHGETLTAIAASGATIYVGFKAGSTGSDGIWIFQGDTTKEPTLTVTLTQPATALAVANNTLYAVLADGSLGQLDPKQTYLPLTVQVQPPLSIAEPSSYSAATPVPMVAASGASVAGGNTNGTLFPSGATLTVDPSLKNDLLLGDSAGNRVVRFVSSQQGPPGLALAGQYAYDKPLAGASQIAVSSIGTTLNAFGWSGGQLFAFSEAEPTS